MKAKVWFEFTLSDNQSITLILNNWILQNNYMLEWIIQYKKSKTLFSDTCIWKLKYIFKYMYLIITSYIQIHIVYVSIFLPTWFEQSKMWKREHCDAYKLPWSWPLAPPCFLLLHPGMTDQEHPYWHAVVPTNLQTNYQTNNVFINEEVNEIARLCLWGGIVSNKW